MRRVLWALAMAAVTAAPVRAGAPGGRPALLVGPEIAIPVPGIDVGRDQLGIDAGIVVDATVYRHVRVGFDLMYHYWPTDAAYKAAIDHFLYSEFLTAIDGAHYAFSAIQASPHVRFESSVGGGAWGWAQIGPGLYVVNHNLAPADWSGGWLQVLGPGMERTSPVFGIHLGVGLDGQPGPHTVLGVDATLHILPVEGDEDLVFGSSPGMVHIPGFTALTLGAHVLFGR